MPQHRYLGEILIDEGLLSQEDLEKALAHQKKQLGEILVELELVAEEDVDRALQIQSKGRTLAQRYLGYLRIVVVLFILASLAAGASAWKVLGDMRFQEALDRARLPADEIRSILESGSVGQRHDALRSVFHLPRREEQTAMLQKALQDPVWTMRLLAAVSARSLGQKEAVPDLIPLLMDEEKAVRDEVRRVLEDLTGQKLGTEFKPWYQWAKARGMSVVQPERMKRPR